MPKNYVSPTAIARASKCIHSWYLECFGDPSKKSKPDAGTLRMFQRGIENEKECIASLANVTDANCDGKDIKAGYKSTLKLMNEGHPWISGAILLTKTGLGFPDLLKREEANSRLGNHTYVPIDIKEHKAVTDKDRFQLLGYAYLLDPVLGNRPTHGGIWLNTGEIEEVNLVDDLDTFEDILKDMNLIKSGKKVTEALRCGECSTCDWSDYCFSLWEQDESVCLLYGITAKKAKQLQNSGFSSWREIAESSLTELASTLRTSQERARPVLLNASAYVKGLPEIIKVPEFPSNVPTHFYDIETYDKAVYLHGDIRIFGKERQVKQFLSKNPSQEMDVWHQYLDYLAQDKEAIIYCWADYERGFVNSLWERFKGNEKGWKHLKNNLVDQCKFVRDHFALPVYSYGIKNVAPVFGFSWSDDDAGGLNSEAWYEEWLSTQNKEILKKILRYNLDDILAMEIIDRKLKAMV